MAIQIQLRKGTATEHNTFTGADGEVTVDTTNKTLRVHDGSTVGGIRLATLAGGLVPVSQLPDATTSVKGAVILNNTLTSTSTTQALTAAQGKFLNDQAFGVGQTWQDVTASRALGTTYTNSTGKPIFVVVSGNPSGLPETLILTIGGVVVWDQTIDGENSDTNVVVSGVVPHNSAYAVSTNGNNTTISRWVELR
jgi:hypothetical protein